MPVQYGHFMQVAHQHCYLFVNFQQDVRRSIDCGVVKRGDAHVCEATAYI